MADPAASRTWGGARPWLATIRAWFPKGRSLSDDGWQIRHRMILTLLWAHIVGLVPFALLTGHTAAHSLLEVAAVAAAALVAGRRDLNRAARSVAATLGLLTTSGLLVHFSGGLIEAHFHFFVMVAVVSLYQDWTPFLLAIGYVVVHHGTVGVLSPESVYNHEAAVSGPWKWALIHGVFIAGESIACLVSWRLVEYNADRRQKAEVDLKNSEERFRSAFASAVAGMALIDPSGQILEANDALSNMLGRDRSDLVNNCWKNIFHPDDVKIAEDVFAKVLDEQFGDSTFTIRQVSESGDPVWADVSIGLVKDPAGAPLHLVYHAHDVSQRHAAEEAVRDSEQRFKALVQNGMSGIAVLDADGKIVYRSPSNDALTHANASVDNPFENVHPDDLPKVEEAFQQLMEDPSRTASIELRVSDGEGGWRWLSVRGTNRLQDPAVKGIIANFEDITEGRALEDQLAQSQKLDAVGRLAGGIAHDFNNLLAVMLSYARFARDELEPGEVRNDVQEVVTAGEKAAELIQQLLTFSRRRFVAPETLDLNEVVGGMEKIFKRTLAENISTSIDLSADPLLVDADTGQIEQVLLNLVVNARDAMPNGGNLSVSTWNVAAGDHKPPGLPDGEYACLAVTDTGTGIDEETLSQMFEPFFTTKPSGRGTGLGLSTIYGVVSQWGGHIDVDTQVGLGTTFLIYLPIASSGHRSKPAPSSNGLSLHGNETVLVVEDEETVRELTKRMLESAGYRTVPAADALEALKVAQDDPSSFDLLLTDVVMPEMSGSELSQRIAELKPDLHTIYMSGYPQDVVASQGVNDELMALLPKPFTPEALLEMVRRNLDSRSEQLEDAGA